jgi:hypothetical protein
VDSCSSKTSCTGSGRCEVDCGQNACDGVIDCAGACACDANCTAPGSCGNGSNCPLGCRDGNGCSADLGCDLCLLSTSQNDHAADTVDPDALGFTATSTSRTPR